MNTFNFWSRPKKSDPDEAVLGQLHKVGENLSKPHKIEFFLYFPIQSAADQAAAYVRNCGFQISVEQSVQGKEWLCFATKTMIPDLSALQNIRKDFERLATSLNGYFDGWGTQAENDSDRTWC